MLTHRIDVRVIYGDTDNMGQAYNANYLRWFEIGRTEMFRFLGLSYREIEEKGIFLPVSEAHIKFIAPVRYDDLITVATSLDESVRGGMKFDYEIRRGDEEKPLATGYTRHACVNREGRVVRPPAFIRDLVSAHTAR